MLVDSFLGMMLGFAILLAAISWFALRAGQPWALAVVAVGNGAVLGIYWFVTIIPYLRETGAGYVQLWHPYALVPSILAPVAGVLGLLGLGPA